MHPKPQAPWENNPSPGNTAHPRFEPARKPPQTFWGHWLVWVSAGVIFAVVLLGAVLSGVLLVEYVEGNIWLDFSRLNGNEPDYIMPEPYNPSPYYYEDPSPCTAYGTAPDDGLTGCSAPDANR